MIRSLTKYLPESLSVRLKDSPVHLRIASGAFWSLAGAVIGQGLTVFASIVLARFLGTEQYGAYGIIQSTISTFAVFAAPVFGIAATKYVAELRNTDPERAGNVIATTMTAGLIATALMSAILWIIAPYLASTTLNEPALGGMLRIATVTLFFTGLIGIQGGILSGFEAFRTLARINLFRGIVSFPVMVILAYLWGLPGSVLALAIIAAVTVYLHQHAIQAEIKDYALPVRYLNPTGEWRMLRIFSLPALLSATVAVAATWATNAMLVNQPNGYADMGIFNAANQWRLAVLFVPVALSRPLLPMLSESLGRNLDEYRQVFRLNLILTALISLVVATVVALLSPWIMSAYGSDFAQYWPVLVLLTFGAVFSALAGVIGNSIWSMGKMWLSLFINMIWATALLGSFSVLTQFGALGLSTAYMFSYVLQLIIASLCMIILMRSRLQIATRP